jgi:hypothetical protein
MKILLRETRKGLFYSGLDDWSVDSTRAVDFEDTTKAIDHAQACGRSDLEIVMRFDDPLLEITLSIVPSRGEERALVDT